jgi:hypothetical protein
MRGVGAAVSPSRDTAVPHIEKEHGRYNRIQRQPACQIYVYSDLHLRGRMSAREQPLTGPLKMDVHWFCEAELP